MPLVELPRGRHLTDQCWIDAPLLAPAATEALASRLLSAIPDPERALRGVTGPFTVCGASQSTGTVFLARDHMGQRPLYYSVLPDRVVAGSDVRAIAAHPDVDDTLDHEAVALLHARCHHAMRQRTEYTQIAQVPAGSVVVINEAGVQIRPYWRPGDQEYSTARSLRDRAEELRELLTTVIGQYTLGVDPAQLSSHVSAGLDSCAVAAFADDLLRASSGQGLSTVYSWSPAPAEPGSTVAATDERTLVQAISKERGWDPMFAFDLAHPPLPDHQIAPMLAWGQEGGVVADAARRGSRVILTGWGGDDAISGHGRLRVPELLTRGRLVTAFREARQFAAANHRPWTRDLWSGARTAWLGQLSKGADQWTLVDQVWQEQWPTVAEAMHEQRQRHSRARTEREYHLVKVTNGHLQARNASWFAGASPLGIEHRHPLQDPRIVDFALASGSECFQHRGWRRIMFRLAIADRVPDYITWRRGKFDPVLFHTGLSSPPRDRYPSVPELDQVHDLARADAQARRTLAAGWSPPSVSIPEPARRPG